MATWMILKKLQILNKEVYVKFSHVISLWITAYNKEPSLFVYTLPVKSTKNTAEIMWYIKGEKTE